MPFGDIDEKDIYIGVYPPDSCIYINLTQLSQLFEKALNEHYEEYQYSDRHIADLQQRIKHSKNYLEKQRLQREINTIKIMKKRRK